MLSTITLTPHPCVWSLLQKFLIPSWFNEKYGWHWELFSFETRSPNNLFVYADLFVRFCTEIHHFILNWQNRTMLCWNHSNRWFYMHRFVLFPGISVIFFGSHLQRTSLIWIHRDLLMEEFYFIVGHRKEFVLPDRNKYVSMDRHFLKSYMDLVVKICHSHGAHATGGMAAPILQNNDPSSESFQQVLGKVTA